MDFLSFPRSKALNNIPFNKVQDVIKSVIDKCEICKSKNINLQDGADGLCERCATASIIYQRYGESNIPLEYWSLKMEKDFKGDKRLLDKYNELANDLRTCFVNGTAIYFSGGHGIGKTMITTCLLKKAVSKGYTALYSTFNDIITTLTQASGEEKFFARKELNMVDFLVIDEVDSRFIASENMADLYARQLEYIVRTRRSNKLPTFMATNSPNIMETFSGPLKQSIQSITSGYMQNFVVLGTDYRKQQ
jgi:DNA replication protein DnaC